MKPETDKEVARVVPASHPHREALGSHVDQDLCEHWPPPPRTRRRPAVTRRSSSSVSPTRSRSAIRRPTAISSRVLVNACSYKEARTLAQNQATNWKLADGACPECP
jgi:hypothetical protein